MFHHNPPTSDTLYGFGYRILFKPLFDTDCFDFYLNDKLYDKLIWHAMQMKAAEYSVNYNLFSLFKV